MMMRAWDRCAMMLAVAVCLNLPLYSCARKSSGPAPLAAQAADHPVGAEGGTSMRLPAVAGQFYPADRTRLAAQVENFLEDADLPSVEGRIVGVMVPHAGYIYSGPVAGFSYKALRGKPIRTVIILGNSHSAYFAGAALSPDSAWDSPLGPVEVDLEVNEQLLAADRIFTHSRSAHANEHSLEVQIPFIKTVLPSAKIVPILLGAVERDDLATIAEALAPVLRRQDTVLVASSDMAHYPAYEDAQRSDKAMLEAIKSLDPDQIRQRDRELMSRRIPNLRCTLCGLDAVETTVLVGKKVGVTEAKVLKYLNSGDTAGDKGQCVGYGAVAFVAPETAAQDKGSSELALTESEKRRLLRVARQTLEAHFGLADKPSLDPGDSKALAQKTACFVTLKFKGRLRGCIGELEPRQPLIEAVADRAIAAALHDPRFLPVTAPELKSIGIEISAMSPLKRVSSPEEIIVGKHGVVVRQGLNSGVFLPQVAPEQGWDRDTMLTKLCTEKAGLPPDAWKRGAELWVFTADVFSEEEFGMAPPGSTKER